MVLLLGRNAMESEMERIIEAIQLITTVVLATIVAGVMLLFGVGLIGMALGL